jgi:serine/threonine protein kinase/Tol biopolymer transport system component
MEHAASDSGPSLSAGDHLGPYEIVRPLGAGGMGEVYRARDPRLRRDVAVKVLRRSLSLTPDHVERLSREARAAGSLNHPNIVAVFDVGREGEVPYVVSELLEGESLASRLARGPLPYRKALEFAAHIADALGAAHAKGIWHRDVKPANAFVTTDGRVKLLDFGLVKLKASESRRADDPTADPTEPGGIHGTFGYMSPEQVLAQPVDHRTDIFAFGALFYEMLTGTPAFRRPSPVESSRATLNHEPADLLENDAGIPPAAVAVVRRCLEKNPEARFQSARDLAFHLHQLGAAAARGAEAASRLRALRLGTLGRIVALLAAVGSGYALAQWLSSTADPVFDQLTFRRGRIGGARFASGGSAVVYSEAREGKPPDVWLLNRLDSPESIRLGYDTADLLALHGNRLALSVGRRFVVGERFAGTLAEAPIGGSPHELAAGVEEADWDPEGRQLVVARSQGIGGRSSLEYPPGTTLYATSHSIRWPRFSRDGQHIAFLEDPTGRGVGGQVAIVDLRRNVRPLTKVWESARGLAWSPDGGEVWFAAGNSRTSRAVQAVDLRGASRQVLALPASVTLWDVASDGRLLLSRDDERSALVGIPPGQHAERDLSWFDTAGLADLSRDGRKLLFDDRFGVYIRETDGSPPVRLGLPQGFGDAISPDGSRVLATISAGQQLVILPAGLGEAVPLPRHDIATHRGALWFPDGRRILFNGGPNLRSYVQDVESGGAPLPVTPENVWTTAISPDGRWLATIQDDRDRAEATRAAIELWPVLGGDPRPVRSSRPGDRPVAWTADGDALWVFRRGEVPAEVSVLDVDSGDRRLWKTLRPGDPSGVYSITDFRITPDGRSYFYSYKRTLSQLYVVSGLR